VRNSKISETHVRHGLDIIERWSGCGTPASDRRPPEQYAGKGYYEGVGRGHPLTAHIFAIADVFDALTSRQPTRSR
jgi:response regulator RpfG family c-di-GMP phosphodiesterase